MRDSLKSNMNAINGATVKMTKSKSPVPLGQLLLERKSNIRIDYSVLNGTPCGVI